MATTCKGCGKPIDWIQTPSGGHMPVDPDPMMVVLKDGRVVQAYRPHWATCTKAEEFHRVRKGH